MGQMILLFVGFILAMGIVLSGIKKTSPLPIGSPFSSPTTITSPPISQPTGIPLPSQKILNTNYQIFQAFNNCGPATLSMALDYYGIHITQDTLGQQLRPYQNPKGDNDDKSVTLDELANKASELGFISYHRPNGTIDLLKQFIAADIPIITETRLKDDDDIGHYRLVIGYDDASHELIQDDSYQGKHVRYGYDRFLALWKTFNYEYLVLIPNGKEQLAEQILGEEVDQLISWKNAVTADQKQIAENPNDMWAQFNLSVALYYTKDYQGSVATYEAVQNKLPFRTLWYHTEPIDAYYQLGNYAKVFSITDQILTNHNLAFSELYLLRGNIYKKQGNTEKAKEEFDKALLYNKNLKVAQDAVQSIP